MVHGQSFMIHQIRKLVGLVVATVRGDVEVEKFGEFFSKTRMRVPKAPGLGLLLDKMYFSGYDNKVGNLPKGEVGGTYDIAV